MQTTSRARRRLDASVLGNPRRNSSTLTTASRSKRATLVAAAVAVLEVVVVVASSAAIVVTVLNVLIAATVPNALNVVNDLTVASSVAAAEVVVNEANIVAVGTEVNSVVEAVAVVAMKPPALRSRLTILLPSPAWEVNRSHARRNRSSTTPTAPHIDHHITSSFSNTHRFVLVKGIFTDHTSKSSFLLSRNLRL